MAKIKDTYRKIRKTEFIYNCGSENGSTSSAVNTGEVWGDVSHAQKALNKQTKINNTDHNKNKKSTPTISLKTLKNMLTITNKQKTSIKITKTKTTSQRQQYN